MTVIFCDEQEGVEAEAVIIQMLQGGISVAEIQAGEVSWIPVTMVEQGAMVTCNVAHDKVSALIRDSYP